MSNLQNAFAPKATPKYQRAGQSFGNERIELVEDKLAAVMTQMLILTDELSTEMDQLQRELREMKMANDVMSETLEYLAQEVTK